MLLRRIITFVRNRGYDNNNIYKCETDGKQHKYKHKYNNYNNSTERTHFKTKNKDLPVKFNFL